MLSGTVIINPPQRDDNLKVTLEPFTPGDIRALLSWNKDAGPDFLTQWAGSGYEYPLTYGQVMGRLGSQSSGDWLIFALREAGRTAGTLELNFINVPSGCATLCRFIIAPERRRRGLGAKALLAAEEYGREKLGLNALRLKVFEYNTTALNCYKRAGYETYGVFTHQNGLPALEMEKRLGP